MNQRLGNIWRILSVSTWTNPMAGGCRCSSRKRDGQTCVASPQVFSLPCLFLLSFESQERPTYLYPPHLKLSWFRHCGVRGSLQRAAHMIQGHAGDSIEEILMGSDTSLL